ncbi:MAG: SH3 domain-containing protein [Peptococcaceae bacterium]|nr:SH3 domain-containing protein [Candidatus Syntrophopropionicum ammoniitolerans]
MHSRYRFTGIFLIALALALFCGFSGANKAFADTAVVATDVLNVRAGPGTNHNMVTQVGRSERFTVVDKSGDWYCVTLNSGQKGWLAGWLVNIEKSPAPTPTPPAAPGVNTTVKVNGSVVNIRSGPGTGYGLVTQVYAGATMPVLGSANDWYNVRLPSGASGWIANWLVSVVTTPTNPVPPPPPPPPSRSDDTGGRNAVVTGSVVNVRGGPGTVNSVVAQVYQGNTLPVLGQSSDWVRVTLPNGGTGWVAGWLVSMQTAPVNPTPPQEPVIPIPTPVQPPEKPTPTPVDPEPTPVKPPENQGSNGGTTPPNSGNVGRGLSLTVNSTGAGTNTVIRTSASCTFSQSVLTKPDRLVVDLKGIEPGNLALVTNVNSQTVNQIRTGHFQRNPDITRVVFDLKDGVLYDVSLSSDAKTVTVQTYIPDIEGSYKNKVIAVDAGHGSPDPGAIGKLGTKEKDITIDIAKRVKKLLEARGAKVIMTRSGEAEIGLYTRTDIANAARANIFVSIHMNANNNAAIGGTSTHVYNGAKTTRVLESARLAGYIQAELVKTLGLRDIGVMYDNFAVLRTTEMPAVLCELAFISNIPEEKYMNTDGFKNSAAEAIVKGIGRYYSEKRNA